MVSVRILPPATNFIRPNDAELGRLFEILAATRPGLAAKTDLLAFARGFIAAGNAFRVPEVSKRAFVSLTEDANLWLQEHDASSVSGHAYLAGIVMHNDIVYRVGNEAIGEVTAAGLDPHHGSPTSNDWKAVLAGAPLRAPLPPRESLTRGKTAPPVTIFQEDRATGALRRVGFRESLWE